MDPFLKTWHGFHKSSGKLGSLKSSQDISPTDPVKNEHAGLFKELWQVNIAFTSLYSKLYFSHSWGDSTKIIPFLTSLCLPSLSAISTNRLDDLFTLQELKHPQDSMPKAKYLELDGIPQELSATVDIIGPIFPELLNYSVKADTSYRSWKVALNLSVSEKLKDPFEIYSFSSCFIVKLWCEAIRELLVYVHG